MVEVDLTKELIEAGEKLVARLDERGLSPDVALWLYSPEERTWKLLLAEAKLSKKGLKAGYAQIQGILAKHAEELGTLGLDDVVLEKPDAKIVGLIRKAVRMGSGLSGIRLRDNVINGTLIDDAYIYRVA